MDNGQHGIVIKPTNGVGQYADFFTAGVGNTPAEDNSYKPEDNLDEENWQQSLEISAPLHMPTPAEAAKLPELPEQEPKNTSEAPIKTPKIPEFPNFSPPEDANSKLGEITTIENSINLPEVKKQSSYNPDSIKTTGDKLEKSSIAEVDNAITELSQTGNLSNFYEEIRSMTEVNLNNSFNRKLYQNNAEGNK